MLNQPQLLYYMQKIKEINHIGRQGSNSVYGPGIGLLKMNGGTPVLGCARHVVRLLIHERGLGLCRHHHIHKPTHFIIEAWCRTKSHVSGK